MLTKKELVTVIMVALILGFTISLIESIKIFAYSFLFILVVILVNLSAKKITAFYYDSEIETKLWTMTRYGYRKGYKFNKPVPTGVIFPLLTTVLSLGYFTWMASLVFDVKTKVYRAAKRHGLYKFTEMTEYHLANIVVAGIGANLLFGIIAYLINQPELARLNLYYAFFQVIPFSDLDGNKLFFGSLVLWSFITAIVLIGVLLSILVI